jgi:hypothetical protein
MSNYVEKLKQAIATELPDDLPDDLLNLYTLLGFTCGARVSNEEVHDAWAIWQNTVNPRHPALLPYNDLSPAIRELDTKYCNGIIRAVEEVNAAKS